MVRLGSTSFAAVLGSIIIGIAWRGGWWPSLLDWAVVAIPALAGLVAWVMPVKQTTRFHRAWLFAGGLILSGLIYFQQWETGAAHAREMARLATKDDIAKLPTIQQIGMEFTRLTATEMKPRVISKAAPATRAAMAPAGSVPPSNREEPTTGGVPSEEIVKGIADIKRLLGSQQWGLTAEQLVMLSRRMAPFATQVNSWVGSPGEDLITSVLGNPDSNRFATSLIAALRSSGWNLPGSGMSLATFTGNPRGVIFILHSRDDADLPVLNQFAATLKEGGISYHGELRDDVPAGQFRLIIGSKPD